MMNEEILRAEALTVGYAGKPVIENISLSARVGRILTLIGPNGVGKSTILKTLIRSLPPIKGSVTLLGKDIRSMTEKEMARTVAVVLTGRPHPELMTCRDVVSSGRYPYTGRLGLLSASDKEKVSEAMELVGVTELADRDYDRISDGQRQRVMLARAICQEPRLLIMDEPTSFLDVKHKLDFLYLLGELVRTRELAVVLSLHELDLAQRFSDRILCVKDGRMDREGTPEEIFTEGYVEKLYGVEHGSYNVTFGGVETEAVKGAPRVFVLGGGGSGVAVYRRLQRMGVPFAAGVLPENDLDWPVAHTLAAELVTERAFEPVSAASVDRAMKLLASCEKLICCTERFGSLNEENKRLLETAEREGKLLSPGALDSLGTV